MCNIILAHLIYCFSMACHLGEGKEEERIIIHCDRMKQNRHKELTTCFAPHTTRLCTRKCVSPFKNLLICHFSEMSFKIYKSSL